MRLTVQQSAVLNTHEGTERRPPVTSDELMVVRSTSHRNQHSGYTIAHTNRRGSFTFTGNEERVVREGDGSYGPPGHRHGVVCEDPSVAIDASTPAREEHRDHFEHIRSYRSSLSIHRKFTALSNP